MREYASGQFKDSLSPDMDRGGLVIGGEYGTIQLGKPLLGYFDPSTSISQSLAYLSACTGIPGSYQAIRESSQRIYGADPY